MLTTETASTTLPFPTGTDQEAVLADIKLLWNMVVTLNNTGTPTGKQQYAQARDLFSQHSEAVNPGQVDEARKLQTALRTLLKQPLGEVTPAVLEDSFDSLFAPAAPVAEPPAAPDPVAQMPGADHTQATPAAPEPEAAGQDGSSGGDGGDGSDDGGDDNEDTDETTPEEGGAEAEASAGMAEAPTQAVLTATPEVPRVPRTVEWDQTLLGSGLVSGLARTLRRGDSVQLVMVRTADGELTVNIVPRPIDGEPGSVNTDLTVRGTPAELDLGLLDAMPTYQEVRKTVRELAADLLEQTQRSAQAAKAKAAAKPPAGKTTPAPAAEGTLKIDLTNADLDRAEVRVAISNKTVTHAGKLAELAEKKLAPGLYTIEVSADDHDVAKSSATVRVGKTETVKISLKPRSAPSLF